MPSSSANTFLSGEASPPSDQSPRSLLSSITSTDTRSGSSYEKYNPRSREFDRSNQTDDVGGDGAGGVGGAKLQNNLKHDKHHSTKIQIVHEETFKNEPVEKIRTGAIIENDDVYDDVHHHEEDDDDGPPPLFADSSSSLVFSNSAKMESRSSLLDPTTTYSQLKQHAQQQQKSEPNESSLLEQMMQDAMVAKKKKEEEEYVKSRKESKNMNFGLKKGFLTSSKKKSRRSRNNNGCKKGKKDVDTTSKGLHTDSNKPLLHEDEEEDDSPPDIIYELDSDGNLIPPPPKKKINKETKSIPTIRPNQNPKTTKNHNNPLRLDEVQEAMKSHPNNISSYLSSNQSEWNTPDLLDEISNNKVLSSGMTNPKFTAALQAFQRNPQKAKEEFQNHPDVIEFLNEFCQVMGNHFMELGKKQEKEEGGGSNDITVTTPNSSTSSSSSTKGKKRNDNIGPMAKKAIHNEIKRQQSSGKSFNDDMSYEEKKKLDSIMADQELTSLLMDVKLQTVMDECSRIPGKMRMYMEDKEYGPKLKKLIHAGLLRVV